jgi:hypothetical protein
MSTFVTNVAALLQDRRDDDSLAAPHAVADRADA